MATDFSQDVVDAALKRLGNYRVRAAQGMALEGPPDEFSGALLLALGLRESGLRNINNPAETDHGTFQISELFHADWLRQQPGCPANTWIAVEGHSAIEDGFCPRYTPACAYALAYLKGAVEFAASKGVPAGDRQRFAVAAYNAGYGGALAGWRAGDMDAQTTSGDYSGWVLRHRSKINNFLGRHSNWTVQP